MRPLDLVALGLAARPRQLQPVVLGDLHHRASVGQPHPRELAVRPRQQLRRVSSLRGVELLDPQDRHVGQAHRLLVGLPEPLVDR